MAKISLSASYYNVPSVIALLSDCDVIYTTNWGSVDKLRELFGELVVRPLPDSCHDMMHFLTTRHKLDTIVSFADLHKLYMLSIAETDKVKKAIERMVRDSDEQDCDFYDV